MKLESYTKLSEEDLKDGLLLCDENGNLHKIIGKVKDKNMWFMSKSNFPHNRGHYWTLEEINQKYNRVVIVPNPK